MENRKILFNDGWEFAKSGLEMTDRSMLEFNQVDIPHDWLIYDTLNLYEDSIGWYRKEYTFSGEADQVLLYFEGVYMDSTLYVNGESVGEWKYGYSSFEHNITEALVEGENEILLKVVHQSPNSRWYSGAGIYRNVWLKERGQNYITTDGVYVSVEQKGDNWLVDIDTELEICEDVVVEHSIIHNNSVIAVSSEEVPVGRENPLADKQTITVEKPLLWSPENPNLYQLKTELLLDSKIIESVNQNLGFRRVELNPDRGFILNGTGMKLNGVCEHHDLGALGAAFNKAALRRRFSLLKEMGVNAIRTAHNMPAVELMELADEMGFLIVSEAFDMWERPKTRYDYARFFGDWAYRDIKNWVRRDRNHPSLIMWSIGNEIYDTHAGERGQELTEMLQKWVKEFDPRGNGSITIGSNYMPWENARKCADIVEVVGYNYGEKYYQEHHEEHPDWIIYGSETGSVVQSRSVYHFPYEESILADDDEQCSALGNSSTSWGADSTEDCIIADRDTPFSLGQFIWTGFDYIGEPTPYHTKNSYFGQLDTATFKKDSYYIYQAEWTDYNEAPMVHIFPYWDFNPGQIIDVQVCSNAPEVELQLNGKTLGRRKINHKNGEKLVVTWKVPYEEGELQALAYDENGNIIAEDIRKSFSDAEEICLEADKEVLTADGRDLIFVEISVKDRDGNPVENASNRIRVEVTGAGRLIGLDNGDSTDYDQYKGMSRRLFNGKLMAVIASTLEPGKIRVSGSSKGLKGCSIELDSVPGFKADGIKTEGNRYKGITADMKNHERQCVVGNDDEIPVRKLELISDIYSAGISNSSSISDSSRTPDSSSVPDSSSRVLDSSRRETSVQAKLYPVDASYQEVEWSIVNDSGIELNIASIETSGHHAKITALGDGDFRVRCTSRNGTDKIRLISELEFKAVGLGTLYKGPYAFISAGLYDYSKGEVSNGNERGVATARDGETQLGFRNIDFGSSGSDTITIPIFALSDDEYSLQIWEGMPEEEGSEMLADVIYQKETRWNVYQEETYRLSKRLRGITSICFVLQNKVHIKGFSFEKKNRAFERINAADSDHIYGDSFSITGDSVEGIGNNVSLVFDNMDFTEKGTEKIVICGRSSIDKNTIHIRFSDGKSEETRIVEFDGSDEYTERIFNLERIKGKQKVSFIFLPGSNFDFKWFKFRQNR